MPTPDVLVIGLGGMGTAACWRLAARGYRVVGLEARAVGHDRGSSHGHTRIIRRAYYEHPAYVPFVSRAYELWHELEVSRGQHLLTASPCLTLGAPGSEVVEGVLRSCAEHSLAVERLSPTDVQRRYPAFRPDPDHVGVLESSAGFLYVDRCVRAMADEARRLRATLHENTPALGWDRRDGRFVVRTADAEFVADRLVLTAGPWVGPLLGGPASALRIMRQVVMWFSPRVPAAFRRDRFPIFLTESGDGFFYGLPMLDPRGVKIARHYGAAEVMTPDDVSRDITDADEVPLRDFIRRTLPDADGPRRDASVCLYTLTPDRHFLIDRVGGHDGAVVAGGFSGHGFKFAPAVGEALAELVAGEAPRVDLSLFNAARLT